MTIRSIYRVRHYHLTPKLPKIVLRDNLPDPCKLTTADRKYQPGDTYSRHVVQKYPYQHLSWCDERFNTETNQIYSKEKQQLFDISRLENEGGKIIN